MDNSREALRSRVNTALQSKPRDGSSHWSVRALGEETGISKSTVQRWFNLFSIQPHRQRHFKLSNDPFFVEKVRDIVGLYLNPPDHAVVLCVDEKTQVQALDRTQPLLPMGLGYVEGVTHDYVRHGTTTLFAALDIASGQVIAQCKKRHRHQEFLAFLNHIDTNVPDPFDIHLIADDYATHKHPKVRAWLAKRPRYHVHFTPTYASWLNQVERWFGIVTQMAIRRGSFSSVSQLVQKIQLFVQNYNRNAAPFGTNLRDTTLADLSDVVGERQIEEIHAASFRQAFLAVLEKRIGAVFVVETDNDGYAGLLRRDESDDYQPRFFGPVFANEDDPHGEAPGFRKITWLQRPDGPCRGPCRPFAPRGQATGADRPRQAGR